MAIAKTKKEVLDEMNVLQKQIESGKIKGKDKLYKARKKVAWLRWKAKKMANGKGKVHSKDVMTIVRRKQPARFIQVQNNVEKLKEQSFLPNFLKQMNVVRIEEMVADKLFKEIKAQLEGLSSDEAESKALGAHVSAQLEKHFPMKIQFTNASNKVKRKAS